MASVVPGAADEALISASASITGFGSVLELALTGTATGLGVSGLFNGDLGYLGGTVTLAANTLLYVQNLLDIGDDSAGTPAGRVPTVVSLGAGSEIEAQASSANAEGIIVGQGGGTATLTVAQPGATVLSYAGSGGTALTVGEGGGSSGLVSLSGSGSALAANGKVSVGFGGAGTIAVAAGARLAAGVDAAGGGVSLGTQGGTGALILATAAQGFLLGETVVGGAGAGVLSVTGGSGLFADSSSGAAIEVGTAAFGSAGVANGSVLVSDPYSFINVSGGIDVGAGGDGALTLENDARLVTGGTASRTTPALSIGLSGTGSVMVQSQAELVALGAGIAVGVDGAGTLSVQSANVTVTTAPSAGVSALDAGVAAGSQGVVDVSGGLILDTQGAGMIIGDSGSGTLTIADAGGGQGGLVLTGDPTAAAGVSVGVSAGATGVVSIDGAASGLGVYGAVDDGLSGRGSIAVSDGGHLIITHGPTVDGLVLGGSSSGTGNLSVANGGQVSVLGYSVIGGAGSGSLTISGGSSFTESAQVGTIYSTFPTVGFPPPPAGLNAAMTLGLTSTGTGSAVISDASTYVPISGGLVVGEAGSGSLSVTNVAILVVSGTIGQAGNIILGDAKGSTGTLSVSAQAQVIDNGAISVGYFGHGELDVSNATLTIDTPNSGALLISAGPLENQVVASGVVNVAGGLIDDVHGSGVIVGESGSATLAISEAGSIGGTVLTGSLAIGENFSTGLVTVDGAASGVGAVTGTSIGDGTLALTNGGRLVTGDSPAGYGLNIHGGAAQLSMAGGAVANVLGQSQISGGALSITGGSGFTGAVDGSAFAQDALSLQAQGDATIGGPGSYLNLTGALAVGDGDGYGSASSMVVENGGLVSVTAAGESDAGVSIGNDPTTDTLVVDGSGSRLIDTGVFAVGGSAAVGNASLTISAGGTVMVAEASGQTGPAAMIGDPDAQAGAGSVATVTGTGSDWTISGTPDRWKPDRHSQAGCSRWRAGECRPGVAERCL